VAAPRQRGDREALRVLLTTRHSATVARVAAVNQLKALSVGAPEELRDQLRGRSTAAQVTYCAGLQAQPFTSLEHRMTVRVLRSTARRVRLLAAEAAELEGEVAKLVAAVAPWLVELWCWAAERRPGAGELVARRPGALRSRLRCPVGVSPIPASSGQVTRHRLNRGGDRQLNRALHTVAVVRLRDDPQTRSYAARRRSEGRHSREIRRCVKRAVAR
jgi:hypothetical protein